MYIFLNRLIPYILSFSRVLIIGVLSDESLYSMPPGWEVPPGWDDDKASLHPNATVPGFDEMMNKKFVQFADMVRTIPDNNDETVDRYNTPTYPTMDPNDAILQAKLQAVTDEIAPAAYLTHFMVNDLVARGVLKSRRVVEAMREIDKEEFAPMDPLNKGHYDYAIDIGYGTWMEAPYQIAGALEYLKRCLTPGSKILEIGAGTGYMTALLASLGGHVYAMEHVPELARDITEHMLSGATRVYGRRNYEVICADGRNGYPEKGPYDVIYASASFPDIPVDILEQLKPGGVLLFTLDQLTGVQKLTAVHKSENNETSIKELNSKIFIPALKDLQTQLETKN